MKQVLREGSHTEILSDSERLERVQHFSEALILRVEDW